MAQRLVVVGGDAAGMSAASQAGRLDPDLEVVAFERGHWTSYSACGIPYWVGGAVDDVDQLVSRTPAQHRENGIDLRMRTEVTAVDLDRREVAWRRLDAGDGPAEGTTGFDQLLLAPGSTPVRPDLPGFDAAGVHGVQTLDDGSALRAALDDGVAGSGGSGAAGGDRRPVRRVVVVGGGYIGLEIAEACAVRGLDVTVLTRSEQPLEVVDPDMGAFVADAVRGEGIRLVTGEEVVGVDVDAAGRARAVRSAGGGRWEADLVVLGLGVRPETSLARAAGVPVGSAGGLVVDVGMRTPVDGVWAAGDCVQSRHLVSGEQVVVALGTHANKQGRVAGTNIGGGYATFPGVIGTAITKVCQLEVARTGLTSAEAERAGFRFEAVTVDSTTTAGYFPGAEPVRLKLLAERGSGRLLGAQVAGRAGSGKRIDALAICCWNAMGVDEVMGLDLSYAPPFAPVWDPVLIAARKAAAAVEAERASRG